MATITNRRNLDRESNDTPPAILSQGALDVAPGAHVRETVRAAGMLRVGDGATLSGAVVADAGAQIGANARLEGPLTVTGALHWGVGAHASHATIKGPVLTGSTIRVSELVATQGIRPRPKGAEE